MAQWLIDWLATASLVELTVVFLVENLLILAIVISAGWALTALFSHRRVALIPEPVTFSDKVYATFSLSTLLQAP